MTLDLSGDMSLADNAKTVTLTTKRAVGDTQIEVVGALKRSLTRPHETFAGLILQGDEVIWNLPNDQLDGAEIEPGDTITDDALSAIDSQSVIWTVLSVSNLSLGTRWRALCRKQR